MTKHATVYWHTLKPTRRLTSASGFVKTELVAHAALAEKAMHRRTCDRDQVKSLQILGMRPARKW